MPRRRFRDFATDALVAVTLILILDKNISGNASGYPTQCTNYHKLNEPHRNVNFFARLLNQCDSKISQVGWYRFTDKAGNILATKTVQEGMCNAKNPGRLIGDHPCVLYETTRAHVCFLSKKDDCKVRVNVSITLCAHFYVYELAAINCTTELRMKYCGQASSVPVSSCINYTRNIPNTDSTKKVDTYSTVTPKSDKNVFTEMKKQVEELDRENMTIESVQNIITKLSNETDLNNMNEMQQKNGLDQQDLIETVEILQMIVDLNISDSSLDIMAPANNILDSRNKISWKNMEGDKTVRNLINTLEKQGFQYGNNMSNSTPLFRNYSNVQLRVKYVTQTKNMSHEEALFQFQDTSFTLSPAALPQESDAVVVVLWYKTMDSILKTKISYDYAKLVTKMITASVRPEPRRRFATPVRIRWNTTRLDNSTTCVFWKPEVNENEWKTDGCKRKSDSNELICECYHLTAFAAMDISRNMVSGDERKALELISTIGCSVSLFGIALTILIHLLLWKRLQQNAKSNIPSHVLLHLCVAIGMTDILAILAGPARNDEKFCMTVSILLYFFVLAVFGWMLCEGIIIYLQLVNVYTGLGLGGRHLKVFYIIGWGFPVFIVSLLVSLSDREDFITKRACWCRGDGVVFWTFVGTICLILLINLVIFILALRSALSSSEVSATRTLRSTTNGGTGTTQAATGTTLRKAKVALKGSAILLPILGLTWLFGLLVFNRDTIVFKYLFAICNSLQGMLIFLFHVVINRKISEAISKEKKTRKDKNMNNIAINNNTCGTLSTSDVSRRKSSIPVTPTFFKKHFNGSESPAVKHSRNTGNENSYSKTPNALKSDRNEGAARSRRVQSNCDIKNENSLKPPKRAYLHPKAAGSQQHRDNSMRQSESIIVEDLL